MAVCGNAAASYGCVVMLLLEPYFESRTLRAFTSCNTFTLCLLSAFVHSTGCLPARVSSALTCYKEATLTCQGWWQQAIPHVDNAREGIRGALYLEALSRSRVLPELSHQRSQLRQLFVQPRPAAIRQRLQISLIYKQMHST